MRSSAMLSRWALLAGMVFTVAACRPTLRCEPTTASVHAAVLAPSCATRGCHAATRSAAGLDLQTLDGLEKRLIGIDAATCENWKLVAPASPEQSFLVNKLEPSPACGAHMPEGKILNPAAVECVSSWVASLDPSLACETCGESVCVDHSSNDRHCGLCGNLCPSGSRCSNWTCVCDGSATMCNGACVDTQTNTQHCGACAKACPASSTCTGGSCACSGGATLCATGCVDTQSDPSNCGTCDKACGALEPFCQLGTCSASCGALTACGNACVDTQTSFFHCSACDATCPSGATCQAGACVCPDGQAACGGSCIDTENDTQNCGSCGHACPAGQQCSAGACVCSDGLVLACGRCVSAAPATYAAVIQPIFNASCATGGCHDGGLQTGPLNNRQSLDLRAGASYANLVNALTDQCSDGRRRVLPSSPGASYLWHKLEGTNMCRGSQMPKQGLSLPSAELDAIWKWICAGAPND
jgi:hypothetical protein